MEFTIDGEEITEGNLKVVIYTSFSDKKEEEILRDSSDSANIVYWLSAQDSEFERLVERTIALKKTEDQFRTLTLTEEQRQYIKILGEEYIGNKTPQASSQKNQGAHSSPHSHISRPFEKRFQSSSKCRFCSLYIPHQEFLCIVAVPLSVSMF